MLLWPGPIKGLAAVSRRALNVEEVLPRVSQRGLHTMSGGPMARISGKLTHYQGELSGVLRRVSEENRKLSLFQVLASVFSSFFGVQKNATRERDFKRGRARDFILVGVLLTLAFILTVWGVVQLVMHVAAP